MTTQVIDQIASKVVSLGLPPEILQWMQITPMRRKLNEEEINEVFVKYREKAKENLVREEFLEPLVFLFGSLPGTTEFFQLVIPLKAFMGSEIMKDLLPLVIREFVKIFDAYACISLSEAWASDETALPGETAKQAKERFDEKSRQFGGVQNMPDRKEIILCSLETKARGVQGMIVIDRDKDGKPVPGKETFDTSNAIGRMAHWIPRTQS